MKRLFKDLLIGRLPAWSEELIQIDVAGLGDDIRELFGGKDIVEPSEDGLFRPVLDAYATGHVLDQMVFDVEVERLLGFINAFLVFVAVVVQELTEVRPLVVIIIEQTPQSLLNPFDSFLAGCDVELGHVACQQHVHVDAVPVLSLVLGYLVPVVIVGQCVCLAEEDVVEDGRLLDLLIGCRYETVSHQWRHKGHNLMGVLVSDDTEGLRLLDQFGKFRILFEAKGRAQFVEVYAGIGQRHLVHILDSAVIEVFDLADGCP